MPWRAREAFFVAILGLVTGLFFSLVLTALIRPDPSVPDERQSLLTIIVTMAIEASLGLWVWLWVKLRHRVGIQALGFKLRRSDVGWGVLAAVVGFIGAGMIVQIVITITEGATGRRIEQPDQLPGLTGGLEIALAAIAVVIVAPIAEEMFFRGFLYQALRRWRGVAFAVVVSAAIFAIVHGAPLLIVGIFPLGVILAYLFERRGSLTATIAAHMTYNLIGFVLIVATGD